MLVFFGSFLDEKQQKTLKGNKHVGGTTLMALFSLLTCPGKMVSTSDLRMGKLTPVVG